MDDDDFLPLDLLFEEDHTADELFRLIRDGSHSQIVSLLPTFEKLSYVLTKTYVCGEGRFSALMLAAHHGHENIVDLLLQQTDPRDQLTIRGSVSAVNGASILDGMPLHCACYAGHFTVAKKLIDSYHADVEQGMYEYRPCPLLVQASAMNRLDIVQFLVENNYADVNASQAAACKEHTALMMAASRGFTPVVEYLIQRGADVNYSCTPGSSACPTAVMLATLAGRPEPVRLLYEAGADMTVKSPDGQSLLAAAYSKHFHPIVRFLLEHSISTVDEFEKLVAHKAIFRFSPPEMAKTLQELKQASQIRQTMCLDKPDVEPLAVYGSHRECRTVDELSAIAVEHQRLIFEILLFGERLFLQHKDANMLEPLRYYGEMLANEGRFDACIKVWVHMFHLYRDAQLATNARRFVWVFCWMLINNQIVPMGQFLQICELADSPWQLQKGEKTLENAFYLVVLGHQILEQQKVPEEEQMAFHQWVIRLCRRQLVTEAGENLLHLCVDQHFRHNLQPGDLDLRQCLSGPHPSILRFILTYARPWLDVNARVKDQLETPLHIVCRTTKDPQSIKLLRESGCHIDCLNNSGNTPLVYLSAGSERDLLQLPLAATQLKCLCAREVHKKQLDTHTLAPSLARFAALHGIRTDP